MLHAARLLAAAGLSMTLIGLTGCAAAPKTLYHWGDYQRQVYESMKSDGSSPTEQLGALMAQAEKARASQESLPPGFRAHLGLLQMRLGQDGEARSSFEAERTAFPESTSFMNFLLKRMGEGRS